MARWRVGQHYGIHVYEDDRPVATFHTVEDAIAAVLAHNNTHEESLDEIVESQTQATRLLAQLDSLRRGIACSLDMRYESPEMFGHVTTPSDAELIRFVREERDSHVNQKARHCASCDGTCSR